MSVNMFNSHIHYFKSDAYRKIWLNDSIKKIYTISVSKLNPNIIPSNIKKRRMRILF